MKNQKTYKNAKESAHMIILGIHEGHCGTACVMIDGRIIACISEERLTRVKNEYGYPGSAINKCLEMARIRSDQIDLVAVSSTQLSLRCALTKVCTTFKMEDFVKVQELYWKPKLLEGKSPDYYDLFKEIIDENKKTIPYDLSSITDRDDPAQFLEARRKNIIKHLKISSEKIHFVDHHEGHSFYAYYASPFRDQDVLVFTIDGFGDGLNATISVAKNNRIQRIFETDQANIGRIYSFMTLLLGMKPTEHEYKVMGLAPYAKEIVAKKPREVFKNTLYVDGLEFKYKERPKDHYFYFREKLHGCRFDGIARGLQDFVEDLIVQWIENAIKQTGIKTVVIAGGVAMNVKANKRIMEIMDVEKFFVAPSPADESLAIGSAYCLMDKYCSENNAKKNSIQPLENAYLGPSFSETEMWDAINAMEEKNDYEIKTDVKAEEVAELLVKGKTIARMAGRMEFGARALGNRSILANPANPDMVMKINGQIKDRDFWMPFTPSILKEREEDYIINPKKVESPFMTITFDGTMLAREHLKAAIHPYDFTVRPQLVEKDQNPSYYAIVKAFEKKTGIGGILNTSLNLHGLPIACSPQDAIHVFRNSGLDCLLMENTILIKKP